ncbi:hypothetical protein Nepgr_026173 [Nepenthes gracilis]|uniref:Bifunctional inhibitor/plant lipid transfer protein/seed storage helical domain-containing protein n=1 Tax=Nepenthes gracilis TaxID=150966 RepID=A0AAD3Y1T1_NEPGR|nr:hypothetical protein Nepgr_026173 [Nepenthes gracilis]
MPNLVIVAVILAVATLVSAHRSPTVITTEVEDQPMSSRCRQQMREQRHKLDDCEQYLRGTVDDGLLSFRRCSNQDCSLRECCGAMEAMDEDCSCEMIRRIVEELRRGEEMEEREVRMIMRKARELPNRCGMGHRRCDIGTVLA